MTASDLTFDLPHTGPPATVDLAGKISLTTVEISGVIVAATSVFTDADSVEVSTTSDFSTVQTLDTTATMDLAVSIDAKETILYVRRPRLDGLNFYESLKIIANCQYGAAAVSDVIILKSDSYNFGSVRNSIHMNAFCFANGAEGHYENCDSPVKWNDSPLSITGDDVSVDYSHA